MLESDVDLIWHTDTEDGEFTEKLSRTKHSKRNNNKNKWEHCNWGNLNKHLI